MKYLVKVKLVAFAAVMLIGTAAYGQFAWTSSPTPATAPSNAFINAGDNEIHYFMQSVTYTAVAGVTAVGQSFTITMPVDGSISVADPDGAGASYANGISVITDALNITVGAVTATSIQILTGAAGVAAAEYVTVIFPVETDSSLSVTGPKSAYTFRTSDDLLDGVITSGVPTTVDSVTFVPEFSGAGLVTFDGTNLNDNGSGATSTDDLGEYLPGDNLGSITAAVPDWVVDVEATFIDAADTWAGFETGLNGTNTNVALDGEILFEVWASQTAGLKYLEVGVAEQLFRHDGGTEIIADNFFENAAITDAFRTAGLDEGIWYFYIGSSATADWAIAQSDTVNVKHYPTFIDPTAATPSWQYDVNGTGQGIDFDQDGTFEPTVATAVSGAAGGDDANILYLDTGNIRGRTGAFVTAGNSYDNIDIFWHGKDVDNPDATIQAYLSDDPSLDIGDVTVLAGLVTDLAGATEITTSPMPLDNPVNYVNYVISQSPVQTAGAYYFYLVTNDGTNQVLQRVTDYDAGAATIQLTVNVSHSPYFEFQQVYAGAPGPLTFDTQTSEHVKISWGQTTLSARDIDATAGDPLIVDLYALPDVGGNGAYAVAAADPFSDAAITGNAAALAIGSVTDTSDSQLDNSYMWSIRSESPALTEFAAAGDEYVIYAVVKQGGDKVVVQYNSDGTPEPGAFADDTELRFTHSPFFQAKNPVPNSSIELVGRDNFDLEWDGFDLTLAGALVQIFISPTASAVDHALTNWGTIAATPGLFWLDVTGVLDGSTKPALTDGVLATGGSFTIDVAEYLDDITGDGVGPAAWGPLLAGGNDVGAIGTEYDVWYMIDENGDNFVAEVPIKAPGTLFFSIEDPGTAQNLRISPNKPLTAAIGDVITLSVEMSTGGAGAAVDQVNLAIDFESDYLSVVDAGSGPFTAGATLINAVINNSSLNGTTYELNGAFDGGSIASAAAWAVIATFNVTVTANPAAGSPVHGIISFVDDGAARVTQIYDDNILPVLTSYDANAADVHLVRPGRITGNVEVEGRSSDLAQDVSFLLVPRGSMQPISNSGYIAANDDDADATNGVGVSLDSNGGFTLSAIPTGTYDLIVRKPGYLDQLITDLTVAPMVDLAQSFIDGNKLFGGDAAGYDHDNSPGTLDLGDNQIDATDDAPAFTAAMTATPDSSAWNALADITGDSLIWADDWAIMVKNQNRTSEGVTYKAMPASGSENLIASLELISEAGDEKTYAVSMLQGTSLRGYAVELGINPSDWELVSYEDGLASHHPALDMHKSLGYDELFISATKGLNPINSDEIEILAVTVRSLTSDPEAISISSAEIVGLDGKMSKAVIATSAGLPEEFTLSQNYPNPFNPVTTINFALPAPGDVKLAVYNLLGQEVQTLVSGSMEPGVYTAMWNSMDNVGRKVSSGVYFYRLVVDGKIMSTKKMVMLK